MLRRMAVATVAAGVTPSSAAATPTVADAAATRASARRGGMTMPAGDSVRESSMTPSVRVSVGPGTNVDDERMRSARPCCAGRAGSANLDVLVVDRSGVSLDLHAVDEEEEIGVGRASGPGAAHPNA